VFHRQVPGVMVTSFQLYPVAPFMVKLFPLTGATRLAAPGVNGPIVAVGHTHPTALGVAPPAT
jgi:hypothetical protein